MINYHDKKFRPVSNTPNGATSDETIFHYEQKGQILTSTYSGGRIIRGHLIGIVDDRGHIDMRYHQLDVDGTLMTGICQSTPEILDDGRVRLHESWQWTSGDRSHGHSIIEEI